MEANLPESYFDILYAKVIMEKMTGDLRKKCGGYLNNSLSQKDDSCLMLTKTDQLKLYFEDILQDVNEMDILRNWDNAMAPLEDDCAGTVELYRLKFYCRDWSETDMKSEAWICKMKRMTIQLLRLEMKMDQSERLLSGL